MSSKGNGLGRWSWSKLSVGAIVAIAVSSARIASAQMTTNQNVARELCALGLASSALVEDTIYLDGGYMSWIVGSGSQQREEEPLQKQILFQVNLTQPMNFTAGTNYSSIVKTMEKLGDSILPPLFNGHMLANAYQFILFGGAIERTDSFQMPPVTWAASKDIRKRDPVPLAKPGDWRPMNMDGATRGIVGGAYVSIPSEDKALVIGGSRTPKWNDVQYNGEKLENSANETSKLVIIADLHEMKTEKFENITTSEFNKFSERSGGEAVWIPTGEQGTVILLGGTALTFYLANNDTKFGADYVNRVRNYGKKLMTTVELYDVKNKQWYQQETTGDAPRETSEFCAVPVTSQDGSIHNIYVYGGTTGVHRSYILNDPLSTDSFVMDPVSDDVHVLSLPSFTWTKLHTGDANFARHGHRCHRISPDRFMVIGGVSHASNGYKCVKDFVRVFDMSAGTWATDYNPTTVPKEYKLPLALQATLKASETGSGAQNTAPGKWASDNLKSLLSTKYPKKPYTPWPYAAVDPNNGNIITNITETDIKTKSSGGLPNYVPPLLGAILGLLVVITILCLVLFWLKKKKAQQKRLMSDSAASTVVNNRRTWSWLIGTQHNEKGHYGMDDDFEGRTPSGTEQGDIYDGSTVTGPMSPVDAQGHQLQGHYQLVGREREAHGHGKRVASEVDGGEIYEMPGDRVSEMPAEAVNRKTVNWEDQAQGGHPGHVSGYSDQLSPPLPGQAGQRNSDPLSPLSPMR